MTDKKQALTDLLAKVEAGDIDKAPFWKVWTPESEDGNLAYTAHSAAKGSLDAAKELHEAVLPNDRARLDIGKRYRAWVISPQNHKIDAYADTPARAWLIAIIKALIAEEAQ